MTTVYVLQSLSDRGRYYVGLTTDVDRRLAAHNAGESKHTAKSRPWKLNLTIQFDDPRKAAAFERYLKSGSGRVFTRRHF